MIYLRVLLHTPVGVLVDERLIGGFKQHAKRSVLHTFQFELFEVAARKPIQKSLSRYSCHLITPAFVKSA